MAQFDKPYMTFYGFGIVIILYCFGVIWHWIILRPWNLA